MKYAPPIGQEAQGEAAHYIDGNPELGILGSPVPAAALEPVQRELVHAIRQAGLVPSGEDLTQLYQAICRIIGKEVPLASKETPGLMQVGAGLTVTDEGLVAVETKAASLITCATAGSVAVKEVTQEGFILSPGVRLDVMFAEVNSALSPMLSVNEGVSRPILFDGAAPEVGDLAKNQIYTLAYTGAAWQIMAGMGRLRIGQFDWWQDTLLRPGIVPCNGCTIANVSETYPQILAYLGTPHGQARCFESLEAREAAHVAIWGDGEYKANWAGVGGLAKFYYDAGTDTLYLPDLVGMFEAMAADGIIAPSTGGVLGDRARGVMGRYGAALGPTANEALSGPFQQTDSAAVGVGNNGLVSNKTVGVMDIGSVVPTGTTIAPRTWGALACVYLGQPATS